MALEQPTTGILQRHYQYLQGKRATSTKPKRSD